jgi:filamentous hemagglutinin family protein
MIKLIVNFLIIFLLFIPKISAIEDLALPKGPQVTDGEVTINNQILGTLNINQISSSATIEWNTFNVGSKASVYFNQPTNTSSIYNDVRSGRSIINGKIYANGKLFLHNPSGIYLGPYSAVQGQGIVLSTLNLLNKNSQTQEHFYASQSDANLETQGLIEAGYVTLISSSIKQLGTIKATGDVQLAASDEVYLKILPNSQLTVKVEPSEIQTALDNQGGIISSQGQVFLKSDIAQSFVDQSINHSNLQATELVNDNGIFKLVSNSGNIKANNIQLSSGKRGATSNSGVLDASTDFDGGIISIEGNQISIQENSILNATGKNQGGKIKIGGEWQGQGSMIQAETTSIDKNTTINASSLGEGDGGTIVVWSDIKNPSSVTSVKGDLIASAINGQGGNIETSGYHLDISSVNINASSDQGADGLWLIDPVDFTIASSGGDMTGSALTTSLASASVTILSSGGSSGTEGDININDAVTWSANKLTLNANNNIYINADLLGSGTAQLDLLYGQGAVASGNTSDYSILKTSSGFSASVNLPDGNNFSTKLGSDGSTVSYTVISSLSFADTGNFAFGTNITDAGSYSRGVKNNFSGNIDGLGHTIDGLTIYHPGGAGWDTGGTGFFAGAYNSTGITAEVSNLGLTNMSQTSIRGFAGAFIGRCRTNCSATIKNSYATGVITNSGGNALGGIVGAVDGTLNIKNSFSNVAVTGYGVTIASSNEGVGGLIGRTGLSATVSIMNSHNRGNVTGTNSWTGGLIGYSYGSPTVTSSYNAGSVSGKNDTGGLIGYAQSALTLTSSYNTGAISSSSNDLGGLVGYANASNTLTSSYNTGTVTGTANNIGGLVGYASAAQTIISSYNTGAIRNSTGTNGNVGGLVGALSSSSASTIQGSYNTGAIYGGYNIGGLVGAAYNASITTSYNTGTVTGFYCHGGNCNNPGGVGGILGTNMTARSGSTYVTISESYNQGTIKGPTGVGGLVGQGRNNTISDSYNKGNVSGSFSYNGQGVSTWLTNYNGGIIGRTDGGTTLSRVYNTGLRVNQDSSTSYMGVHGAFIGTKTDVFYLQASTGSVSSGQRALSSSDMQTLSNFTNYDSELIWINNSSVNSGYPLLINNDPVEIITFAANDLSFTYGTTIDTSSFLANNYYTISGGYSLAEAFSANPGFGIYLGDSLISDTTPNTGSYSITPSGGTVNSGYLISYNSGTLTVNAKALTVSGITASNKTYDGNTTANVTLTLSGVIDGETVTSTNSSTFNNKNADSGKTVTVNSITLNDTNYSISSGQTTTANIIAKALTVSGITASNKTYDGNAIAALSTASASYDGLISGDDLTVSASGAFSNKNVGTGKTVTLTSSYSGDDISNYSITDQSSTTANIVQLSSVTWTGDGDGDAWSTAANWTSSAIPDNNNVAAVVIPANASVEYDADNLGAVGSTITNSGTLTFTGSTDLTFANVISGTGSVVKSGTGSLTLSGANTFSGGMNYGSSTLIISNSFAATSFTSSGGNLSISPTLRTIDLTGPTTISSDITTTGTQRYRGNIIVASGSIASPVEFSSTNADIIFDGILKADATGKSRSMTFDAGTANLIFNDRIGYNFNSADFDPDLTADSFYKMIFNAGSITVKGDVMTFEEQVYNGPVIIGSNNNGVTRTLLSMDPAITFNSTVNDTIANTHNLIAKAVEVRRVGEVATTPVVTFASYVGNNISLASHQGLTGYQIIDEKFGNIDTSIDFGTVNAAPIITSSNNSSSAAVKAKKAASNAVKSISPIRTTSGFQPTMAGPSIKLSRTYSIDISYGVPAATPRPAVAAPAKNNTNLNQSGSSNNFTSEPRPAVAAPAKNNTNTNQSGSSNNSTSENSSNSNQSGSDNSTTSEIEPAGDASSDNNSNQNQSESENNPDSDANDDSDSEDEENLETNEL